MSIDANLQTKNRLLMVALRGWTNSNDLLIRLKGDHGGEFPEEFLRFLDSTLQEKFDVEIWAPKLPLAMFSMADPEEIVRNLLKELTRKVEEQNYEEIHLIGFSTGSLLARGLFCAVNGATDEGEVDPASIHDCAPKITRIVNVSAITRGWEISSATPFSVRFFMPILNLCADIRGTLHKLTNSRFWSLRRFFDPAPLIYKVKRGAPFVTLTQLQFLAVHRRLLRAKQQLPTIVYLLGSQDEFVSPADAMDFGPRECSTYLEVPNSKHFDLLLISPTNGHDTSIDTRTTIYRQALLDPIAKLEESIYRVDYEDLDNNLDSLDRPRETGQSEVFPDVDVAVMVVHGIRDNGFWTKRVARLVKNVGSQAGKIARAPAPSYGYFSAWDFIRPNGRLEATYWFMERYVQIKATYPKAEISFIGHSNGTFLAARAMELCKAVKLTNIVFAGSVVRTQFEWSAILRGSPAKLFNITASKDHVVRMLPGFIERIGFSFMHCGGAGYFGFRDPDTIADNRVQQLAITGSHSAGISEGYWVRLARAAVLGIPFERNELKPHPAQSISMLTTLLVDFALIAIGTAIFGLLGLAFLWAWRTVSLPNSVPIEVMVTLLATLAVYRAAKLL